jgi:hypothetical protein
VNSTRVQWVSSSFAETAAARAPSRCTISGLNLYRSGAILLALLVLLEGWGGAALAPEESSKNVIAIGDVHGDFDDFVAILQHTGLIDKQHHWAGSTNILVQVGDSLDRGPKPRDVMDLLMALEKEAPKDGGRVESLLGNHEMMNLMGDLRYVTPENYASFADANSEERRQSAFKEYLNWREKHTALLAELAQPMELTEAEWMARHPAGFIEQREAFSPKGSYGKWLRGHAALAEIDGVIFLHGGISPGLASLTPKVINSRIRDEINAFDSCKQYMVDQRLILPFFNLQEITAVVQAEISAEQKSKTASVPDLRTKISEFLQFPDWLSVRTDGPLWFRGFDQWSDAEGTSQIEKILQSFKAEHFVTGHTVQKGGSIRSRFGGKVLLIDTGMLSGYYPGGKASALEIRNKVTFTAKYMDQQITLLEPVKVAP